MSEPITFRVSCLHPNEFEGAISLQATKVCGYGHAFTIEQMNNNLVKKGSPYISIDYCKYCDNENTLGVLDESNSELRRILGFVILHPHESETMFYEIVEMKTK